jgi:hypothetical protein
MAFFNCSAAESEQLAVRAPDLAMGVPVFVTDTQ